MPNPKTRRPETNPIPNPGPTILTEPQLPEKPSKKTKVMNKIVIAALGIALFLIGLMFYWASVNSEVLQVKTQPFPTRTIREHPTANGVVFVTADVCKRYNVEGEIRTSFVSQSREIFLPLGKERMEKGCTQAEIPVLIPKDIIPDTYKVKFRVTYDLNPLKKDVTQTFESKEVIIDAETAENQLPPNSFPTQPKQAQ